MVTITNPVIAGMAPDPSIIRVEDDYYIATSTFHWTPGVQLFHSRDLNTWQLIGYPLDSKKINLMGTDTPAGIWAPHLSYDKKRKEFWIAYSHMVNMSGREFNAESYAIHSKNINGPWSEPIYLTSIGFDPAIFHDEDGKSYVSILEWESRPNHQAPGHIVISEFDISNGKQLSEWHRVTQGFTTRGAAEAPQLYKHNNHYYLLIAAGGTGYAHGVEVGRSESIFGPYEPHPSMEPIVTSSPKHLFSLGDPDAGQFQMYNPQSRIQKSGHGSLVETQTGELYLAHLMSRPLMGTQFNPLGRETGIQKMKWTSDDWLEMFDGSNLAKVSVPGLSGVSLTKQRNDLIFNFDNNTIPQEFMTPYHFQDDSWVRVNKNSQNLRIYGGNSLFSKDKPNILATRAISFNYEIKTAIKFKPLHYSQSAGVGLYYDSNNWIYFNLFWSEEENRKKIRISQSKLSERIQYNYVESPVDSETIDVKVTYNDGKVSAYFKDKDNETFKTIQENIDVTYLSDEGVNGAPGEIGGFTGLFNFIGSVDAYQHESYADFEYYYVTSKESSEEK
ncbi:family 43 glycosylhydrolase [Leuconostoc pseudomesenteroides]|uniref:family 43 glycosylhydrolase n=1 Tax=Leuconostoc pseudomesenteroides TaxID=33968 RepID=UPI004035D9AF